MYYTTQGLWGTFNDNLALLIVEIVWDNVTMDDWILGRISDDITKQREPGIEIIECTPYSLIISSIRNYENICINLW